MHSFSVVAIASLIASAVAFPQGHEIPSDCGANVILTGLPPFHKLVAQQGFTPAKVEKGLREQYDNLIQAGYNVRFALMGPEQGVGKLESRLEGTDWQATAVGMGVRGSQLPDLTIWLEDVIATYHRKTPNTPIVFNYNPESTVWAFSHRILLKDDCPAGKGLGFELHCDATNCPNANTTAT